MEKSEQRRDEKFYRDVSKITVQGLAEIRSVFDQFYDELANKFQPYLENMASRELPEASDQLAAIVEATETAAANIMDSLEDMQKDHDRARILLTSMLEDPALAPAHRQALTEVLESGETNGKRVVNIFEELSFQDLTGQRIKRIVSLVRNVEDRVQDMLGALGRKVHDIEITQESEQSELKGPQRPGQALDQNDIDALLAAL